MLFESKFPLVCLYYKWYKLVFGKKKTSFYFTYGNLISLIFSQYWATDIFVMVTYWRCSCVGKGGYIRGVLEIINIM